ncbi:prephenate/arogenate dehydrogenase [Microseira sp. BLCC-F43]|jgi:arogenate dehydrogenase (NADP+)|uniref:prephenate/arogenate dehydrogenase n=1 Tax=Microseira sp. BLCC-F43 TaxID=3153602 RepID=UPI0035B7E2E1
MNVGIVGLGLIGGSLALDLRPKGYRILGVSRKEETCRAAIARGIVDDASTNLSFLATADVIFICSPISLIVPIVKELIPHLSVEAILTDVGSVKTPIVPEVSEIWPNFVGGHPMAGTAESGLDAAISNLFVGRPYVLTPIETTPPEAVKTVEEIAGSLGSQIYFCTPEDHDRAVAWISHLPVMISAGLITACMNETDGAVLKLAQNLASSGFKDTSRVGGGNPELGVMMARYNRGELLRSLQQYRHTLDKLIDDIEREDWEALEQQLKHTQQARPQFLE